MKKLMAAASAAILALGITACSNNSPSATDASPGTEQTNTASPTSSAAQETVAPSSPAAPDASETASSSPAAPSPEQTETAKIYRMNKVYRIVPIDKEKTDGKAVLLTFDDGPKDKETLDPLLDTLDKHKAKAIFFVNGYRVKAHPELLKAIDERGQTIGNHAWDHIELGKEKESTIEEQISKVQEIVREVTGKTPVFFRPPFASANPSVHQIAKDNGLLFMTWSNGSLDWAMNKVAREKRPQAVIDNVMEQLHDGSNILMHELPWTGEALDSLLTQLEQKGYAFIDPEAIDTELEG